MKLRNKKTGGLANIDDLCVHTDAGFHDYSSLTELNEEWEDYEEHYWVVDYITCGVDNLAIDTKEPEMDDFNKQIGNYFETKEEAEKAVEKLKAWKRLKDAGCGFILDDHFNVKFVGPDARKITSAEEQKSLSDTYNLLFGGGE